MNNVTDFVAAPSASQFPSVPPSRFPSVSPSQIPSLSPSLFPSLSPSLSPTQKPVSSSKIFSRSEGMTLQAIGFTLGGGLCITLFATVAFGIAVSRRSTNIAPRCTARHPNTIYRSRKDIYHKARKGKRKNNRQSSFNARTGSTAQTQPPNAVEETAKTNNKSTLRSSTPLKTARQATRKSTAIATKLVTGLDLDGLCAAEQKQHVEEEEAQRREFVNNAIGQPVYVGAGARRRESSHLPKTSEHLSGSRAEGRTNSDAQNEGMPRQNSGGRWNPGHGAVVVTAAQSHSSNSGMGSERAMDVEGKLYDVDSGVAVDELGKEVSAAKEQDCADEEAMDYDMENNEQFIHPQDRGNPFLGWIPWTLHLSYDRMLRGIPGTGTRCGGMGGKLLGVNLDAVVLFRFHDLCLRVTAMATFLCICIILPINLSACSPGDEYCNQHANLTNYGRTTIANIIQTTNTTNVETQNFQFWTAFFWTHSSVSHLIRLYAISICTWIITYYTLKNVKREWRENLVLRRVYYLEADHYGIRQSELEKTIYNPHAEDTDEESQASDDDDDAMDIRTRRAINQGQNPKKKPKYKCRQPWIPHPEHRDTIPNIELYSVLVGGLPSLPTEVVNTEDIETAIGFSKRASIDWQLAVATTFFDHCVPNQPGFSSSVVAVTILPAAPELAKAWRKWYAAAAALRRLRFIRTIINEKRYYDIDEVGGGDEESAKTSTKEIGSNDVHSERTPTRDIPQSRPRVTFLDDETASSRFYDEEMKRQISQYRQAYGSSEGVSDLDYRIFRSLNYGPEQQAVYSREMAQGAAACCPNGCCEGRVRRQPIDRLLEMEEATIERLENAQYQLQCAQMQAAVSIVDKGDTPHKKGKSFDETEMMLQNTEPTIKTSPIRSVVQLVPTNYSSDCAGVELPTLDEIFSSSNECIESIDIQPKCQDVIGSASNEGSRSLSKSISNGSNCSLRDKKLAVETSRSRDSFNSDASSKVINNSRQSTSSALRTINEHANDPRKVSSPAQNLDIASPGSIFPHALGGSILRMTSEGRFLFNNTINDNDDESLSTSAFNANSFGVNHTDQDVLSPTESSLRRRTLTGQSSKTVKSDAEQTKASNQWEQVKNILRKDDAEGQTENAKNKHEIETGVWTMPSFKSTASSLKRNITAHLKAIGRWTKVKTSDNILTKKLAKDSTYAVVTFSSRQAAVAARHCLADGRGVHRWLSLETVPVPPLADAAPFDLITCRGCCRPVTLNLNQNQLMIRRYIALASLVFIYIFYTIPITTAQKVVEPSNLQTTLPGFYNLFNNSSFLSADIISGLISGLLYTTFFALCPVMFKMIANAGSQATSVQEAEKYALNYYWYFMLTTAFVFTYIADAAIDLWYHSNVEQSLSELVTNIANATPLRTSATWLNWIIVRTTMTLPLQYMLQINTFIFGCIGWKCCARCTMGGGPGGPIPYRIYIDGGVVFVCVIALAPQSPLVAPMALLYYVICTPLWRRNCIFMYRPKFDSGGERWPFLSDVMITSLYMGQFLLTLQMALRDAFGPALFAGLPAVPTYLYRNYLHKRFKRAYQDAGLLQTSLLDGWDNTIPSSVEKREEFRKFLVDAHKAAYIPVCIAGGATNILTAEPAVVIPNENDDMIGYSELTSSLKPELLINSPGSPYFGDQAPIFQPVRGNHRDSEDFTAATNRGACMRRAMSFSTPRSSLAAHNYADSVGPGITANGTETNKQNLFSQKWQRAQEEMESMSIQNEDPGCTQQ